MSFGPSQPLAASIRPSMWSRLAFTEASRLAASTARTRDCTTHSEIESFASGDAGIAAVGVDQGFGGHRRFSGIEGRGAARRWPDDAPRMGAAAAGAGAAGYVAVALMRSAAAAWFGEGLQQQPVESLTARVAELAQPDRHRHVAEAWLGEVGAGQPVPPRQREAEVAIGLQWIDRVMHAVHVGP